MVDLETAARRVRQRSNGFCEGCGHRDPLDVHHRQARGAGGVHGEAAEIANDIRNLLALCRVCHDSTEQAEDWLACIGIGWRIPHLVDLDPREVPALLWTVNGPGWWLLTDDAGYCWLDWSRWQRITLDDLSARSWRTPCYRPDPLEAITGPAPLVSATVSPRR